MLDDVDVEPAASGVRRANELDGISPAGRGAVAVAQAHAAQANDRDFQAAFSKCAFLHTEYLSGQEFGASSP